MPGGHRAGLCDAEAGAQGGHRLGSRWATASGHPPRGPAPWPFCSTWRDPRGGASPGLMTRPPHRLSAVHSEQLTPHEHPLHISHRPLRPRSASWDTCSTSFPSGFLPTSPGSVPRGGGARRAGSGAQGDTHGRRFPGGRGPRSARPPELGTLLPLHRSIQPGRARWVRRGLWVRAKPGWGQQTH